MIAGCVWRDRNGPFAPAPGLGATDMRALGPLDYSDYPVERHHHLHHIFPGNGADHLSLGAEVEFARGCPYSCTFCNKTLFRNKYRERELSAVLAEIDQLIARGVDYIYFIDEIFGVGKQVRELLEEIAKRPVSIGFQSRIDLWDEESHRSARPRPLRLLRVRRRVHHRRRPRRDEQELPHHHRPHHRAPDLRQAAHPVGPGQPHQDARRRSRLVAAWQTNLKASGVWVSEPVPMFPFPGSPEYVTTFGAQPDEQAWERAHAFYLQLFADKGFSDIQEQQPSRSRSWSAKQELACASC